MIARFVVSTDVSNEGLITQVVAAKRNEYVEIISHQVIDTMELQVRDALIALGWTPPKQIKR